MKSKKEMGNLDEFVMLSFFADVGIGIAAASTINEAIQQVMEKIGDIFSPLCWSLLLLDNETGELYFKKVSGENADKLENVRIPHDEGISGWVMENGQALLVEDVSQEERYSTRVDKITGFKTKSIIAVPLKVNEEIIGVFELINKGKDGAYSNTELKILTTIADYAAITIEKVYYLSALKDLSNVDALTGIFNRKSLDVSFSKEIERSKRYGHPVSAIMSDIDGLKTINDELGYPSGDKALIIASKIIKKNIRKIDIAARYGGDEFVILLPHTKKNEAENVRQRIYKDIEKECGAESEVNFTITMGLHCEGPEKVDELLKLVKKDLRKEKKKKQKKQPSKPS